MINIFMNEANFDAPWAYANVAPYMKKDAHVVVMAFLSDDGWSEDYLEWEFRYRKGARSYEKIMSVFRNYQIKEENVSWINPATADHDRAASMIAKADILYLCGNNPEVMMRGILSLDLHRTFLEFEGVLISDACGSAICMEQFDSIYEWEDEACNGMGLLRGFALEPDYHEDVRHLNRLLRDIEMKGLAVFAYGKDGGVIIDHGHYELLGNAFTCTQYDLDNIYNALEDAKQRQAYYGNDWEE